MDEETARFINALINRVKSEHTFDDVMKEWGQNKASYKGRWDTPARRIFGKLVREVFQDTFPNEPRTSLYVEGEGSTTLQHTKLFGSGIYPDIAVKKPSKIAVELDHSEKGSGLKMALAKAAFNTLSGDFQYCLLLFYNQNGKLSLDNGIEKRICKIYEEQFHTWVFLFK